MPERPGFNPEAEPSTKGQPGNVPEYGAGSYGELPRHREARLVGRERVTAAARDIRDVLDNTPDDPETYAVLAQLLDVLDSYRVKIERHRNAEPYPLDHADA